MATLQDNLQHTTPVVWDGVGPDPVDEVGERFLDRLELVAAGVFIAAVLITAVVQVGRALGWWL